MDKKDIESVPDSTSFISDIYSLWGHLSDISAWMSISSLVLTIVLLFNTKNLKDKVQASYKFTAFKKDKNGLANELESIRNLVKLNPDSKQNLYDLSEPLRRLADYKEFMDKQDKDAFEELLSIVKSGSVVNVSAKIIHNLGVLIGFLKRRMDIDLENI
jgi:hypothetical protein